MPASPRVVTIAAPVVIALALAARADGAVSLLSAPATSTPATPASVTSPVATPLPLYTPIPPSEARNVVGRVTIELTDRGFIPSRFEEAVNQPLTITLVNTGARRHNFSIDALDIDVDVDPGQTKTFSISSPRRLGRYTFYSDTPEDRALGMTGTMTVFI